MRLIVTRVFIFFCISLSLYGRQCIAKNLDLKAAIAYAMVHNPHLKALQLDKTVRLHELKILKQKFSPQVAFNLSLSVQNEDYFNEDFNEKKLHTYPSLRLLTPVGTQIEVFTEQNVGYEQYQRNSGSAVHVTLEQPLLKGRSKTVNKWSIENGAALNEIQELLLNQASSQVIYNVILRYHALMLALDNVSSQERWLAQAQRFYDSMKIKVDVGRAPSSDLTSSMLQLNQAKGYVATAQFAHKEAIRAFKEVIGWEEEEELSITPISFSKHLFTLDKNSLIQQVMDNDIESKILNLNKQRLKTQLAVAKDQQLIDLKLKGDITVGRYHVYGNNNVPDIYDSTVYNAPFVHNSGNYSAHLLMSIPLTGKEERKHFALATKVEQQKNADEFNAHQRILVTHTTGLLEKLELQKQQLTLSRQQLSLAQKNYDDALMKLEAGRTSMFEVTSLREKLHDMQISHNSTKIAYLDIIAQVDFSTGVLPQKWLS
ncbi:MAG: TolC family protein [Proteobacteria bacterium]|nr:TolC family protein [Pseudomonadota bacterium]